MDTIKVLHLLAAGGVGGIEILCKDYAAYSKHDNTFLFVWQGGPIADEMKSYNRKVIELNASKANILSPLISIYKTCIQKKIDFLIVHHSSPAILLYAFFVRMLRPSTRIIVYAHCNAVDMCRTEKKRGLRLRKLIIENSLKIANNVVAISESVKKSLYEYYNLTRTEIDVIYNGVDISRFAYEERPLKSPVELIYVGRLIKEKGVQHILNMLSFLPANIDYHFRIIGDGPYRASLEQLVKELQLQENVFFLGTRRDIPSLLSSSDIFIHIPIWSEGFGITIVEAMASGVIPFCNSSGAIPEIIQHGISGFIVADNDPAIIAGELKKLIDNLHNGNIFSVRHNTVLRAKEFSIESFAQNLDQMICKNRGHDT